MIIRARVPRPMTDALPEGNPADLLYLEEAVAALSQIMAVCAGAGRSARPDVRALARAALSVQADRFTAVSAVLHGWGRSDGPGRAAAAGVDALDGLDGEALDRAFVEGLTAYTHASTVRSRAELVAGASRATRHLAELAIHEDDRQLAGLRAFLRVQAQQQTGAPVFHDPMARWNDDGGSWPGVSAATPPGD